MFYLLYTSRWGTENECAAREQFKVVMKAQHSNFSISVSGLVINTQYPHLGASPDGVTMCECCGKGVVELKCPYSARDYTVHESALDYLEYAADSIRLKKETHTSIKCKPKSFCVKHNLHTLQYGHQKESTLNV